MKYNINNNNLYQIFSKLEKQLKENEVLIKELIKVDSNYCKIKVDLETLKNIVNKLKNEKIDLQKEQNIMINYNGNPYVTLNLSVLAIITKTTIFLNFNKKMLGINTFIVRTVNEILKDMNTEKLIYIEEKTRQDIDKIICIDDINQYNSYLREKMRKQNFTVLIIWIFIVIVITLKK